MFYFVTLSEKCPEVNQKIIFTADDAKLRIGYVAENKILYWTRCKLGEVAIIRDSKRIHWIDYNEFWDALLGGNE